MNNLKILPKDVDEPEIQYVSGNNLKIVEKYEFYAHNKDFSTRNFQEEFI